MTKMTKVKNDAVKVGRKLEVSCILHPVSYNSTKSLVTPYFVSERLLVYYEILLKKSLVKIENSPQQNNT